MTKEQIEACEKLGQHHLGSWYKDNDYPVFEEGFQAAQSPEILMLNPLVKGLVEALKKTKHLGNCSCNDVGGFDICSYCQITHHRIKALAPFKKDPNATR